MMSPAQGAEALLAMIVFGGIAGLTVIGVMSLLLEQQVELWEAVLLAGLAVSLLGATLSSVGTHWFLLALTANIALVIIVYWLVISSRTSDPKHFLAQDEQRAAAAIEHDPNNAAAREFLGDIYCKQGKYDEALEQYRIALDQIKSLAAEQDALRRAIERTQREAEDRRRCAQCGNLMARRAAWCPHCGARTARLGWIVPTDPAEARRFWTIAGLAVAGFVVAGLVESVAGWWAWAGLFAWIVGIVIVLSKPEERIPVAGHGREVDARVEDDGGE